MQIEQRKSPCRLRVGTSGYSYAEWVNAGFYPPGTRSDQMLPLYAQTFPITELNFTWYQMPKAATIERLRAFALERQPGIAQNNFYVRGATIQIPKIIFGDFEY